MSDVRVFNVRRAEYADPWHAVRATTPAIAAKVFVECSALEISCEKDDPALIEVKGGGLERMHTYEVWSVTETKFFARQTCASNS